MNLFLCWSSLYLALGFLSQATASGKIVDEPTKLEAEEYHRRNLRTTNLHHRNRNFPVMNTKRGGLSRQTLPRYLPRDLNRKFPRDLTRDFNHKDAMDHVKRVYQDLFQEVPSSCEEMEKGIVQVIEGLEAIKQSLYKCEEPMIDGPMIGGPMIDAFELEGPPLKVNPKSFGDKFFKQKGPQDPPLSIFSKPKSVIIAKPEVDDNVDGEPEDEGDEESEDKGENNDENDADIEVAKNEITGCLDMCKVDNFDAEGRVWSFCDKCCQECTITVALDDCDCLEQAHELFPEHIRPKHFRAKANVVESKLNLN